MNDANNFKPESYNPSKYDSYAHQSSNSDYAGNSYNRNNDYDQRKLPLITNTQGSMDHGIHTWNKSGIIKINFSSRIELGSKII